MLERHPLVVPDLLDLAAFLRSDVRLRQMFREIESAIGQQKFTAAAMELEAVLRKYRDWKYVDPW